MALPGRQSEPRSRPLWPSVKPRGALLAALWLGAGWTLADAPATAGGPGGAKLDKPMALTVSGGSCESDGKGSVGANFGNALAFNIGPRTVGMPAMSKAPYT